jgi:hypothetical protein
VEEEGKKITDDCFFSSSTFVKESLFLEGDLVSTKKQMQMHHQQQRQEK